MRKGLGKMLWWNNGWSDGGLLTADGDNKTVFKL